MTTIERLTLKLLDGTITEEEVEDLETRVARGEPGVHDHFLLLDVEAALRGLGPGPDLRQPTMDRLRAELRTRMQEAVLREIAARPTPGWLRTSPKAIGPGRRTRVVGASIAAAAVVLLTLGLIALRRGLTPTGPDPSPGARVVDLRGRLEILNPGGGSRMASVGQEIAPGQILRTADAESFAVVEYADRTRLDLSPDSSVRLMGSEPGRVRAGKRILLTSGVLRADVSPQPAGESLVIVTPLAEVRVAGAAALLSATNPDSTWIDLEDGRAEMVRQADGRQVEVEAGSSATVRADLDEIVVRSWAQPMPRPRHRLEFVAAHTLAFTKDGGTLLAANSQRLGRYSLATGEERIEPIPVPFQLGMRAAISGDGGTLALSLPDGLSVWDIPPTRRRLEIATEGVPVRSFAVAADGRWLAAQDADPDHPARVLVWDVETGRLRTSWEVDGPVRNLASSPDGSLLVVGTRESPQAPTQRILFWDAVAGKHQATLLTDLPASWQIVLTPDGERLATVGRDSRIQIWHLPRRSLERVIDARERQVRSLAFSPDGRLLAGGTNSGSVLLWDVATGAEHPELKVEQRCVVSLAFSPDGRTLATGTLHDPVLLWDVPQPTGLPEGQDRSVQMMTRPEIIHP